MAAYTPDGHGPAAVNAVANTYVDLIASDASNVHIIRTIEVVNTGASSRIVYVSIGAGAAGTEVIELTVLAHSTETRNLWLKVPLSTAVQTKQDAGTDCTITIGGYHYA